MRFCPPSPRVTREIGGAHGPAAGEIGERGGLLVVGVGADHEHAPHDIEPRQRQADLAAPARLSSPFAITAMRNGEQNQKLRPK
jgi:hypothetical protein